MVLSQLSVYPIGIGTSLSKYVKIAIDVLKKNNIKYEINDMATVIETKDIESLFELVKKIRNALVEAGAERIMIELKIDDRLDKTVKLGDKRRAVQ